MYKKFRFVRTGLAGDVFYSPSQPPKASGLFLYGLPSFIGQNEVTYSLVKADIAAFQPHYFGTYDSDSIYSPRTAIRTCEKTQEIFDSGHVEPIGKVGTVFELPSLKICVGHSFGALVALRATKHLTSLTKLVLLAPTVHYRKESPNFGNKANGHAILDSIELANPHTYRLAPRSEWNELMDGNDPVPDAQSHPTLREVIAVAGEDDPYLDISALRETLPQLIHGYCGPGITFRLVIVPSAGHTLSDLVEAGEMFSLQEECEEL